MGGLRLALGLLLFAGCSSGGGSTPAGASFAGTWSGTGTRLGKSPTTATVIVSGTSFSVTTESGGVTATSSGNVLALTYTRSGLVHTSTATRSSGGGMQTNLPIDLSGTWAVTPPNPQGDEGCDYVAVTGAVSGSCKTVGALPGVFPSGFRVSNGKATGARISSGASIFGELGGVWRVDASGGGHCDVTFEGNNFVAVCANADKLTGQMQVTIDGDVASGKNSDGLEFSATRR